MEVYNGVQHVCLGRDGGTDGRIQVAVESTVDYVGPGFYARLIDLDKQNADGSWGKVQEFYRIACIDCVGSRVARVCALDARQFLSFEEAREAVLEDVGLRLVSYDDLIHLCGQYRFGYGGLGVVGLAGTLGNAYARAAEGSGCGSARDVVEIEK